MGVSPSDGSYGGDRFTVVGDLRLPPPEHSCKVHCNQAHYVPMYGGGEVSGATGVQAVVGTGSIAIGRHGEGSPGGGMDIWRGGDGRDGDGDELNRWEDTVENLNLGMEPNAALAYSTGLELHHLIMSMIGGHKGLSERERH